MTDAVEPEPQTTYHRDRASARTADEREAHFQHMITKTIPYYDAVEAAGDEPWFSSVEERRELYMRRYKSAPAIRNNPPWRSQ